MQSSSYDVTVLGAGPGGYVAAIRAAQLGQRVAIIEREALGGVCLNWGCIPTKALLKLAEKYEFLRGAGDQGFDIGPVSVRWDAIIGKSRQAAERLSKGVAFLMKKNRIDVLRGTGRFASAHRLLVTDAAGEISEVQTTHAIIATGARPVILPGIDRDSPRVLTSREAMVLPTLPKSMTIIGGGAIGLEFAWFFATFGTYVTLVEYFPRILPSGDAEISTALAKSFRRRGIEIVTGARVTGVADRGAGVATSVERDGKTETLEADFALVAVGVRPNVEDIGLEQIGVRLEKSAIRVDEHCQTSVRGVWAIGDVNGPPALAHVASAEAVHAVEHLAGRRPHPLNRDAIPACIYCQPQVAQVGLTEEEAIDAGHDVRVGRFPNAANGKAVAIGETEGFVKIVADSATGELLGAHLIGSDATELIGELTLGKTAELRVQDIHSTVHAHPTLSESVLEAAADWAGEAIQI